MSNRDARCETCFYWMRGDPYLAQEAPAAASADCIGTCVVNPPRVVVSVGIFTSTWPRTHEDRFCGAWTPTNDGDGDGEKIDTVVPFRSAA